MNRFKKSFLFFLSTLVFLYLKFLFINSKVVAKPITLFQKNDLLTKVFSTQQTDDELSDNTSARPIAVVSSTDIV